MVVKKGDEKDVGSKAAVRRKKNLEEVVWGQKEVDEKEEYSRYPRVLCGYVQVTLYLS